MVKRCLSCPNRDLAYCFRISTTAVLWFLLKWLTIMDIRVKILIFWSDCDALRKAMLDCFQASLGKKVAVAIDCFEILWMAFQSQSTTSTWSSCKHHNTVKVLMGITPQGIILFVSKTWGGQLQVSDKQSTCSWQVTSRWHCSSR